LLPYEIESDWANAPIKPGNKIIRMQSIFFILLLIENK